MKMVVGLGNPGKEYQFTRHNVGFIVLDDYLKDIVWKEKFNAYYYIKDNVCFVKPLTYMNNSGTAVVAFKNYYKVDVKDILVIQDDLDMKVGTYKVKRNSSDGGHNGLKSIINMLNSNEFGRLKIGILNDNKYDTIDFVLGNFSKEELEFIKDNNDFKKVIDLFIKYGIERALDSYRR